MAGGRHRGEEGGEGGRRSEEAAAFLWQLAQAEAREVPATLVDCTRGVFRGEATDSPVY